ncbi:MAG TPA: GNAT family N-acetyltransferase [Allosphingosinicella sp.]|nr:GNAT family N-acetyltransferase [Allosphingosinicella sp.]
MTGTVTVRPARLDEHGLLEQLQKDASLALDEYRERLLEHPEVLGIPEEFIGDGRVLVAESGGQLSGYAAWLPMSARVAELDGLFVRPDRWRQGIGRRLIQAVAEAAADDFYDALFVVANPTANTFYLRCGFLRTGETKTQFGVAITMSLALRASGAAGPRQGW